MRAELRPKFTSDSSLRSLFLSRARGVKSGTRESEYGNGLYATIVAHDDTGALASMDGVTSMINRFRWKREHARTAPANSGNAKSLAKMSEDRERERTMRHGSEVGGGGIKKGEAISRKDITRRN